jgi:glycosyltransferase involved in cell wall biosynthesis
MPDRRRRDGLRVALLSPCYWPEVRRGTERFVRDLATGLLRRGHRPTLITSHPGLPSRSLEDGLAVIRLSRPPERPLERARFESYLTHVPFSYGALSGGRYDVAHAVYPTDALAAARWRRRTGRPALLSYMGIPSPEWLDAARGRREILRRAIGGCDATLVLSDHAADAMRDSLGHIPRVIAPGADLAVFQPAASRAERPTLVCSAAPEVERKHVRLLIDAFSLLRRQRADARLVLSRPRDARAALALGIDTTVRLDGVEWANLDDQGALVRAYSEAWVSVLPSVGEAFGLVLVEALACGTPVVGHAHGALPEVIDRPEIGRLFEPLEPEPLSRALSEALDLAGDPETALRCRARAEEFSTDVCVENYVSLYRELIAASARAA